MKFRKKPVVIEAIQYTGSNDKEILNFVGASFQENVGRLYIRTLEGDMRLSKEDWVIKGVNGEFYPCKPDIFDQTYELVE